MTLTKIALTVLGTIGLTAGTVLAVSEPMPKPLPDSAPPSACSSCKSAASACPQKAACGTARCDAAAARAAETINACAAEKPCCDKAAQCDVRSGSCDSASSACDAIGGPVGPGFGEAVSAEASCKVAKCGETACNAECSESHAAASACREAKSECDKAARRTIGAGVGSDSGVTGTIVLTAGVEKGTCGDGGCPTEKDGCRGHHVYGIDFKSGLSPSIKARTVFVENCRRCAEADGEESASACDSSECAKARPVAATACEAKPACATATCATAACEASACPISACATAACEKSECSACPNARCDAAKDLARNTEPAAECCETCADCKCGSCACGDADEVGVAVEAPGRVRIMSIVPPHLLTGDVRHILSGFEFDRPRRRIALSSFTAPVVAPVPPPTARPSIATVQGTWTRTHGPATTTFTCRDGRIEGTHRLAVDGEAKATIRVAGVCSASSDGLLYGVIEAIEIDPAADSDDSMLALRLLEQPFSIRFTTDSESLILKDVRCAGLSASVEDGEPGELLELARLALCGRYTPTDAE